MSDDNAEYVLAQINDDLRVRIAELERFVSVWDDWQERALLSTRTLVAARKALEADE